MSLHTAGNTNSKTIKMKQQQITKTEEAKKSVSLLIDNQLYNSAVNRIYFAMYYTLREFASSQKYESSSFNELLDWFENYSQENRVENSYTALLRTTYNSGLLADYELSRFYSADEVSTLLVGLNRFQNKIKELLQPIDWVQESLKALKKAAQILQNPANSRVEIKKAEYLFSFFKSLFQKNKKAQTTLALFKHSFKNLKLETKLEVRIEDILDENPSLTQEFKTILFDFYKQEKKPVKEKKKIEVSVKKVKEKKIETPDNKELRIKKESVSESIITSKKEVFKAKIKEKRDDKLEQKPVKNSHFLVPWDFTKVAGFALRHALMFHKNTDAQITLVHIVKRKKELSAAKEKLQQLAGELSLEHAVSISGMVRVGNFFNDISKIANEIKPDAIFMGTHGMKGMQKVTGSWALKVITNTRAPFVVVQAPPSESVNDIIFPVDYRREEKTKLREARWLSKLFNVKFYICIPAKFNDMTIKKRTMNNVNFAQQYFKQHQINFELSTVEGTSSFADATLKFATALQPEMILVLTTKNIGFQDYLTGADEQKIIANKLKIPVMCVNPRN